MEEPDRSPPVLILRVFSSSAFTLIPGGSDGLPLRGLNRCGPKQKNGNTMKALLFLPSYIEMTWKEIGSKTFVVVVVIVVPSI